MPWFYARAGSTERLGPVSSEQMRGLLTGGEVGPADLVWREGMTEWTSVERLPKLAALLPRAQPTPMVAPAGGSPLNNGSHPGAPAYAPLTASFANHVSVAAPDPRMVAEPIAAPASLGYYAPRGDMPARAQANLAKYATPTGPNGDWPLDDERVAQFAYAARLRRRINAAYGLSRLCTLLLVISTAVMIPVSLTAAMSSRAAATESVVMFGMLALYVGLSVLYFLAGQAMRYCRVWGSLTLAILTSLWMVLWVLFLSIGLVAASSTARSGDLIGPVIGGGFGLLVGGAICFTFWRAFAATKPYLNSPVWCQEAIAAGERAK